MIDSKMLSLLHDDAVVINASRGEVVCSSALLERNITCALDVWENEPHIDAQLLERAFVTTPHIAGYSLQGKANATAMSVGALADHFQLPLKDWYPPQCSPTIPMEIDWQKLCQTIDSYCNLENESAPLKNGGNFESLRNSYHYREEYF
jgi:erythronate-4-phosphate dehydrogenase